MAGSHQGSKLAGYARGGMAAAVAPARRTLSTTRPAAPRAAGGLRSLLPSASVKVRDRAIFFRQFSVMIGAGLPLIQCLEILAANQECVRFAIALTGVRVAVEGGSTLSGAMRHYPEAFDDLSCNLVEAGESGGILDTVLQRLATYVEKAMKMRNALKSALVYPAAVVTMAMLIVGALLKWVVPIFATLFVGLGVTLPLPTRIVMELSHLVGVYWWVAILGVAGGIYALRRYRRTAAGRYRTDRFLLALPVLGKVLRKVAVARFSRTMGTLLSSGVPILEGLAITARTAGNAVIEEALFKVRKAVEEGRNMVDPLRESGVFPAMVCHMVDVGEATGALDTMLNKIADFYEDDVDIATKDLLASLEPIIIGVLGVVVGGIVLSLYMPLFSMISKLAG